MAICRVKCRLMPANWNPLSAVSYLKSLNEKRASRLQHPRSVGLHKIQSSVMALEQFLNECRKSNFKRIPAQQREVVADLSS